jgi:Flp pilus assembly protein TadD
MSDPKDTGRMLRIIQPMVAGLLAFALYLNTLHGPFLFDDWTYIAENPLIRHLDHFLRPGTLQEHLAQEGVRLPYADLFDSFVRRPMSYLTFALNYRLHGTDSFGYNLVNVFIHVSATLLLYLFTSQLVKQLPEQTGSQHTRTAVPFLTALLFACHPVQTQAVSYTNQRVASLAAMFFLLSLSTYLLSCRALPGRRRFWYASALLSAICGMLSKETVFTLPVVVVLTDALCFRESIRIRLPRLTPFLATMAIIPLAMALNSNSDGLQDGLYRANTQQIPHLSYLFTQSRVLVTYLRLLIVPVNQQLDYDYPLYHSPFEPAVFLSALLLLAMIAGGIFLLHRGMTLKRSLPLLTGFGILWFFITLSMESALVPLDDLIFEHRLYLPSVGIFLATSAAGTQLFETFAVNRIRRMAVIAVTITIIAVFSAATIRRNSLWADAVRFSEDNAAKSPRKERVRIHLGDTYLRAGMAEKALAVYDGIRLTADTPQHVFTNMANACLRTGDFNKGIALYRQALERDSNDYIPPSMLGVILLSRGELDDAEDLLNTALSLNRFDPIARKARAEMFRRSGRITAARHDYEQLLTITPEDAEAAAVLQMLRRQEARKPDHAE